MNLTELYLNSMLNRNTINNCIPMWLSDMSNPNYTRHRQIKDWKIVEELLIAAYSTIKEMPVQKPLCKINPDGFTKHLYESEYL